MIGTLKVALRRSVSVIRRLITFKFINILPGTSVVSRAFQLGRPGANGEIIVSQRPASGSTAIPVVRYVFVNAATGVPVTNRVTVKGTRIVVLPFHLPAGTFQLKMINAGSGKVNLEGVILIF